MFHFPPYFLSSPARAFTDTLAKATHTPAQFFSTFHRLAARYVFAKTLATASGALASLLVRVTDASVFSPCDITASAAAPVRYLQDAAVLILALLILHARVGAIRRASKCEWRGEQHYE